MVLYAELTQSQMDMEIFLAYSILLIAQYFAITSIPISILGGLLSRLCSNLHLGLFLAGLVVWNIIDLIWLAFLGNHLPLLAIVLSIGFQFWSSRDRRMTEASQLMIVAGSWSILAVAIYVWIFRGFDFV